MKKLLMLMLVLGFATAANAAVLDIGLFWFDGTNYLDEAPATVLGTTITVNVIGDKTVKGTNGIDFGEGTSTGTLSLGSWQVATTTGTDGTLTGNDIIDASYTSTAAATAGTVLYTFDYAVAAGVSGGGTVQAMMQTGDKFTNGLTAYLWEGTGAHSTVLSDLTIVPEPMTIALLGLGGLFLRRRK